MKIVITGPTRRAREQLIDRCVTAGLDVTTSVSSVTNLLVCNDRALRTRKLTDAALHATPVIDESGLLRLLADVRPGTRKDVARPASTAIAPVPTRKTGTKPSGPLTGRRVLVLGRPHQAAAEARARLTSSGAVASVNLTASVTDIVLLGGGHDDPRADKARARGLGLLTWPDLQPTAWPAPPTEPVRRPPADVTADPFIASRALPTEAAVINPAASRPDVLTRGATINLPGDPVWTFNISWQAVAGRADREVDVVAFLLDRNEKVTTDADFVFYNQPVSEDGAVRLAEDGSSEQSIRLDLPALPTWCARVEIAAAITGTGTFADVGAVVVDVDAGDDSTGGSRPVATTTLDAATTERTMLLASVYRRGEVWRVRAVGQGYDTDLAHLARSFGVNIDD